MEDREKIKYVLENISREDTAEYMAEVLMDDENSTWKMYEEMAGDYLNGNEEFSKGFNMACILLTGWSMETMAEQIISEYDKG